jgi:DNA-binding MarR family transcriptional regulator
MTSVKAHFPREEWHATLLMGLLLRDVREVFAGEDWKGLRQSHFRVITAVLPEGISVTELGDRVGMSKQGCGQFVSALAESGHLRVSPDSQDGRVRLVRRTAEGERTVRAVTARMLRIEDEWAQQVGPERYRAFRSVLEELAQPAG